MQQCNLIQRTRQICNFVKLEVSKLPSFIKLEFFNSPPRNGGENTNYPENCYHREFLIVKSFLLFIFAFSLLNRFVWLLWEGQRFLFSPLILLCPPLPPPLPPPPSPPQIGAELLISGSACNIPRLLQHL